MIRTFSKRIPAPDFDPGCLQTSPLPFAQRAANTGLMKLLRAVILPALVCMPCVAAAQSKVLFLKFPAKDVTALGQIDRLVVTVTCSWIGSLENVPELYNVRMAYDMPTENVFEAVPRLGAAAVDLRRWNGVIGVRIPLDADSKSCFAVKVTAESSYNSAERHWTGQQLGLPK